MRPVGALVVAAFGVSVARVEGRVGAGVGLLPPPPQATRRVALATSVNAINAYIHDFVKGHLIVFGGCFSTSVALLFGRR